MGFSAVTNDTVSRFFLQGNFKTFYISVLDGTYLNRQKVQDDIVTNMMEQLGIPAGARLRVSAMRIEADFTPFCDHLAAKKIHKLRIHYYFFNSELNIKSVTGSDWSNIHGKHPFVYHPVILNSLTQGFNLCEATNRN